MIRFIGDIHGHLKPYFRIAAGAKQSVQIGDFGWGWFNEQKTTQINEFHTDTQHGRHAFIRGNHDSPQKCKQAPGWIEDGYHDAENDIFYVGGAWSIDWAVRNPGLTWWPDEELSDAQFEELIERYKVLKPKIVVTHDAPNIAIVSGFSFPNEFGEFTETRTSTALQTMFDHHMPDLWIFGHWHKHVDVVVSGCRFICLAELQAVDVQPKTMEVSYPQGK